MKKNILIAFVVISSAVLFSACTNNNQSDQSPSNIDATEIVKTVLPDRPAEINGQVKSIEGNEVVVLNELKEVLNDEDRAARQEERANLSQEARQALRQEEMEAVETEQLTLQIPVGVPIMTGSGNADGSNISASLADIKSGTYLSVWRDTNGQVEAVKIKGLN
ncbi:MAG: hypothetical protein ABFQ62_01110 [Patescibacteria group bacterium]